MGMHLEKVRQQKFNVFLDIHELTEKLRTTYSKDYRASISTQKLLTLVWEAIQGMEYFAQQGFKKSTHVDQSKAENSANYYALQNLLELVATLMTPNEEYSLLESSVRNLINQSHPNADEWLRALGESRNRSMHQSLTFSARDTSAHLSHMLSFKQDILAKEEFQRDVSTLYRTRNYATF